ncbi:cytochrome P450 1A5-like [Thamnophis elegans]|uniref:cytochrome P450 1A5-like n=1 Tax=Thamnophis elegans TaxID=35005 RepID=UPI00137908B6|nr:cytochrome P450 1A5-like [Thamnophis elegans]
MTSALVNSRSMVSAPEILICAAVFCLLLLLLKNRRRIPAGLRKLRGPRGYPFIGNILDLGKNPHLALTRLSQEYGDVMLIHLGARPVVVLSGSETIKQALVKQGRDFAGRPDLYSFKFIGDGQTFSFGRNSEESWRVRRRLAQTALKTFAGSTSPNSSTCLLEEHISQEAEYLVKKFLDLMKEKESFEPFQYVVISVVNVICAMCFGKRYNHEDRELLNIVDINNDFGLVAASGNPADFFPILQYLPSRSMEAFKDLNRRFNVLMKKLVEEHYEGFDKNNIRDITDSLISFCQDKNPNLNANDALKDQNIVGIVNELFGAGFDTVTTALSWCLLYLVTYPEIQRRIQEELDQIIGRERTPKQSDRAMLPYSEAFMYEMFRHSSFIPFTIPHCTTRDTALNGFYIPNDTCVFVNQWQVNHDPKLWSEPSVFNPERFLMTDRTGINRAECDKVMTFGLGRRQCIGQSIAKWEVFLFLTTLVQKLEFTLSGTETMDTTPQYGLTMKYKKCEHFRVKPRF